MHPSQLAWPAVIAAAFVLFWAPVIIAAIRRTDRIGIVVTLTMLTLLLPPAWFVALAAPFFLPRKGAVRPHGTVPPHLAGPVYWHGIPPHAAAPDADPRGARATSGPPPRW